MIFFFIFKFLCTEAALGNLKTEENYIKRITEQGYLKKQMIKAQKLLSVNIAFKLKSNEIIDFRREIYKNLITLCAYQPFLKCFHVKTEYKFIKHEIYKEFKALERNDAEKLKEMSFLMAKTVYFQIHKVLELEANVIVEPIAQSVYCRNIKCLMNWHNEYLKILNYFMMLKEDLLPLTLKLLEKYKKATNKVTDKYKIDKLLLMVATEHLENSVYLIRMCTIACILLEREMRILEKNQKDTLKSFNKI